MDAQRSATGTARSGGDAYPVVATAGSLYSAAQGTQSLWAMIPGDAVHVVTPALLWVPRSVRAFFANRPERRS